VTNVFPNVTDFITNFSAAVWTVGAGGIVNNLDDVAVIGPVGATACALVPTCQFAGGSVLLYPGSFYLEFIGTGGGTSGYGGNLSTTQIADTGALDMGDAAARLRWRRLHGLSQSNPAFHIV
jgi:hypothetical protein